MQTRYYDPHTGRFINADDIAYLDPETLTGLNLFAYCGNNPVMNIDPSGLIPFASSFTKLFYKKDIFGVDSRWWGRIIYSITIIEEQTDRNGLFYAYSGVDQTNLASYGAGFNAWGWLGVEYGVDSEFNVSVGMSITPWFHFNTSVGMNGITISVGINISGASHDISFGVGLAPIGIAIGVGVILLSGGGSTTVVLEWFKRLFA